MLGVAGGLGRTEEGVAVALEQEVVEARESAAEPGQVDAALRRRRPTPGAPTSWLWTEVSQNSFDNDAVTKFLFGPWIATK